MENQIISILNETKNIDDWKLLSVKKDCDESYCIRSSQEMRRKISVIHYELVIYRRIHVNGAHYMGEASILLAPTMTESEIRDKVSQTLYSASFVHNQPYELNSVLAPETLCSYEPVDVTSTNEATIHSFMQYIGSEGANLNSAEFFCRNRLYHFTNSRGVSVQWSSSESEVYAVMDYKGAHDVELFRIWTYAPNGEPDLKKAVSQLSEQTVWRSQAKSIPHIPESSPVIISGDALVDFFDYFYQKCAARKVYEKTSVFKIGDQFHTDKCLGDTISITLAPCMKGSSKSAPYDEDGVALKPVQIIDKGFVKQLWGSHRFCSYLEIPVTGVIENIIVAPGKSSMSNWIKDGVFIELFAFSDFQMNALTGDFGGEIRLGRLTNNGKSTLFHGGSLSGNIRNIIDNLFLSRECTQYNHYLGPEAIKMTGVEIAADNQ